MQVHINPSFEASSAVLVGTQLNNQALELERQGDLQGAETLHLRAIEIKERGLGSNSIGAALSRNALGELYIKMGRLDDAEDNLKRAVEIRNSDGNTFDAAVSRDNLAQVFEMRGKFKEASDLRLSGLPDKISCGNFTCPGQLFSIDQLSRCSWCHAVYYCSKSCQTADWKSRHKKYCKDLSKDQRSL